MKNVYLIYEVEHNSCKFTLKRINERNEKLFNKRHICKWISFDTFWRSFQSQKNQWNIYFDFTASTDCASKLSIKASAISKKTMRKKRRKKNLCWKARDLVATAIPSTLSDLGAIDWEARENPALSFPFAQNELIDEASRLTGDGGIK